MIGVPTAGVSKVAVTSHEEPAAEIPSLVVGEMMLDGQSSPAPRTSTAYGIPQFLDSTWKGTGIGKTSDGYRQIDAGLIYIDSRYGSPCGAWSHSQSTGWY